VKIGPNSGTVRGVKVLTFGVLLVCSVLLGCSSGSEDGEGPDAAGGASGGAPSKPPAAPSPVLLQACERWCGTYEIFTQGECEPGEALLNGRRLESNDAPAVDDDPACMEPCLALEPGECEEGRAADQVCNADALWICDGDGWGALDYCQGGSALLCGAGDDPTRDDAWEPNEAWRIACSKQCALLASLDGECTPGQRLFRGAPLGLRPPDSAPLSDDEACVEACMVPVSGMDCWQQAARVYTCTSNEVWVCDDDATWGIAADCDIPESELVCD
jgi:hypothetical protein